MAHFLTIVNSGNLLKVEYLPQYSRSKHQVQISVLFLSKMVLSGLTSLGRMRLRRVDSWELSEGDSVSGGEVGGVSGLFVLCEEKGISVPREVPRMGWRRHHSPGEHLPPLGGLQPAC